MDTGKKYEISWLYHNASSQHLAATNPLCEKTYSILFVYFLVSAEQDRFDNHNTIYFRSTKTGVRQLRMWTVRDPAPISKSSVYLAIDLKSDIKDW